MVPGCAAGNRVSLYLSPEVNDRLQMLSSHSSFSLPFLTLSHVFFLRSVIFSTFMTVFLLWTFSFLQTHPKKFQTRRWISRSIPWACNQMWLSQCDNVIDILLRNLCPSVCLRPSYIPQPPYPPIPPLFYCKWLKWHPCKVLFLGGIVSELSCAFIHVGTQMSL